MNETVTISRETYDKMVEELRVLKIGESVRYEYLMQELLEIKSGKTEVVYRNGRSTRTYFVTDSELVNKYEGEAEKLQAYKNRNLWQRILNKDVES